LAVYGSNGGGKSNLMSAIWLMDSLVHNSFKDSLSKNEDRPPWDFNYRLCSETINKPTMFEVSFLHEDKIYRYGFEMYNWKVIGEWLFRTDKRETMLFDRIGSDIQYNEKSFPEGKRKDDVNSNVLFISFLAQYNSIESSKVFNFFDNLNVVSGLDDRNVNHVTMGLLKNDSHFKKWLSIALRFLEINSVKVSSDKKSLLTSHAVYNNDNLVEGFVDFDVDNNESDGTKKLIYLLGAIYDSLKHGKLFAIDEFDSKLHPNLSLKLLRLLHELNNNGAQFIITAHDPTFLDKEVFRRDQIWFVDRNQFGVSELYPMSDFKATDGLRSMSDFRKKYLNSDFGAAESIELTDEFINLTKEI
jgi:AAA15 family ATPase/GTPase